MSDRTEPTLETPATLRVEVGEYVFATYPNEYRIAVFRHGELHYWIERYSAVLALMYAVESAQVPVVGGPSVSVAEAFGDIVEGELEEPVVEPFDIPSTDYELRIIDQAFDPDYGGWCAHFEAIGAPRLSHQSRDPVLEAYVRLEAAPANAKRLGSGSQQGSALVREAETPQSVFDRTPEMAVLQNAFGAAFIETDAPKNVPIGMPTEEQLLAAMQKSLVKHLEKVREERARLSVTEQGATFVGKTFKVKG